MPDGHERGGNKTEDGPRALPPDPGVHSIAGIKKLYH